MKLLLHTCCAPCSVYCIEELKKENIDITSYWYNPNIHPYTEYSKRLDCLIKFNEKKNIPLIVENYYGLDEFCKNVINKLDNRCGYCYYNRLEKTALYAKKHGYDCFSTTLLISPYQNHELLKKTGELLEKKYDIKFLYKDFRIGFRYGQNKARELGLYMQKYCGCIFSEEDRYYYQKSDQLNLDDGFKFLPVKNDIIIRKEKNNKEKYINLLLDDFVNKELKNISIFLLTYKEKEICIAIVDEMNEKFIELKNIITKKDYKNLGYEDKMIKYLIDNYKQKYNKMMVVITLDKIPFYVKYGFDKYEKKIENGLFCYSKQLK